MTPEQIIQYVLSFLGGGLVVAVGNWVNLSIAARRQREIDYLEEQLQSLYGPLSFFVLQNEKLFELCVKIDGAYKTELSDANWSPDDRTRTSVRAEAKSTINIENQYIKRIFENNIRVMDILEKGWHLVEGEDVAEFAKFQVDFTRLSTECAGTVQLPFSIYNAVGEISYMRPSLMELIKKRVNAKQARLRKLGVRGSAVLATL